MIRRYWKPSFKWQLVEWLFQKYKDEGKEIPKNRLERMTKKQLYAIYYEIRDQIIKNRSITGEGVSRA